MENNYYKIEHTLPLIPLRGMSIFPYMVLNFDIGRDVSLKAINSCQGNDDLVFLTSQKSLEIDDPTEDDFYHTGVICKIKQIIKLPGNAVRTVVEGISRAKIKELEFENGYYKATVEEIVYENYNDDIETKALIRNVLDAFEEYINIGNRVSGEILVTLSEMENIDKLMDTICANIYLKSSQKQELLEEFDIKLRLELLLKTLLEELEILKLEKNIALKVKKQVNKVQKDYYLKEQMRAIQKELGEDDDIDTEVEKFRESLRKLKATKEIKEKIEKEINKFSKLSSMSPDSSISRNYLETIFSLPWNKESREKIDLKIAEDILNENHYGMEKVKERIIEYLAVRKLSNSLKSPIICLVGPPGVGKTSIAKSIADAIGRKFVRISLGGVRDEAEIRGHRRTYVGAIPGRIINGLKEAKTKNPVFLLDEIDKMSSDYKGSPASAMLEVLDPEQNKNFVDHYLELPFDLSKILFVTTANSLSTIPRPLLDRMEIIEVSGYIEEEKLNISKNYLLPKQIKQNGLRENFLKMDDETIREVINSYTRESGVRNLERTLGTICRKVAKKYVDNLELKEVVVSKDDLNEYLGKIKYRHEVAGLNPEVELLWGLLGHRLEEKL